MEKEREIKQGCLSPILISFGMADRKHYLLHEETRNNRIIYTNPWCYWHFDRYIHLFYGPT